jgi:hypothetical protein
VTIRENVVPTAFVVMMVIMDRTVNTGINS